MCIIEQKLFLLKYMAVGKSFRPFCFEVFVSFCNGSLQMHLVSSITRRFTNKSLTSRFIIFVSHLMFKIVQSHALCLTYVYCKRDMNNILKFLLGRVETHCNKGIASYAYQISQLSFTNLSYV